MALAAAFRALADKLQELDSFITGLHVTAVEDRPPPGDHILLHTTSNAAADLEGSCKAALTAARAALNATSAPVDLERAGQALCTAQAEFNSLAKRFTFLISYGYLRALTAVAEKKRGEWCPWVVSLKRGLRNCESPVVDVNEALLSCWVEIVDQIGRTSVSVRTSSIGQKIHVAEGVSFSPT